MASGPTAEEMKTLKESLKATRKRVKGNEEEARSVLQAAGIITKKGRLAAPYRATQDD